MGACDPMVCPIRAMQARAKVDITDIVRQLREDRMGMVQHTSQYKFIYQVSCVLWVCCGCAVGCGLWDVGCGLWAVGCRCAVCCVLCAVCCVRVLCCAV